MAIYGNILPRNFSTDGSKNCAPSPPALRSPFTCGPGDGSHGVSEMTPYIKDIDLLATMIDSNINEYHWKSILMINGWWLVYLPFCKIWFRQLRWWNIPNWTNKNMFQTTKQFMLKILLGVWGSSWSLPQTWSFFSGISLDAAWTQGLGTSRCFSAKSMVNHPVIPWYTSRKT